MSPLLYRLSYTATSHTINGLHVVSQARTSLLCRKCARNELYSTLDHPPVSQRDITREFSVTNVQVKTQKPHTRRREAHGTILVPSDLYLN